MSCSLLSLGSLRTGWRRWRRWAALTALATLAVPVFAAAPAQAAILGARSHSTDEPRPTTGNCPWLSTSFPVATRVAMLEAAMTSDEETALLRLDWGRSAGSPYEGETPAIPALCIPTITEQDGSAGVGSGWEFASKTAFQGATQLPSPIADAAAFDPQLARAYGVVVGKEDAATGVDVALAPTVNIERDPLWGRAYETLGEDPYLSASLGIALVDGIQSQRVVAVLKHFAAYNQETYRGTTADDVIVSTRALREIYLPAFAATVRQAHPGGVMCSYALINGVPACQNKELLQGILRGEWHFTGFVRSDCGSVFDQQAAVLAGVSQVKCGRVYDPEELTIAVRHGAVTRADLDALTTPLLTVLFEDNLIRQPHPARPDAEVSTAADRTVARRTDDEGAVLLKNDGILPLNLGRLSSVALIGDGDGTPMPTGFGAMRVLDSRPVTALEALTAKVGKGRLIYEPGSDLKGAIEAARRARVVILVVHDFETEGRDRTSLVLPGDQDRLVTDVEAANHHTIVVLETGAPVLMPWLAQTPAVLETWYPGQQAGNSLVDLVSGAYDPSGKLPVTWPASAGARPDTSPAAFGGVGGHVDYRDSIDVGYRWYQTHHVTPAFSFGDGLSYTTFGFANLRLAHSRRGDVQVSATVRNDGHVSGSDVVQLYVGDPAAAGEPPRQLRGFDRVTLRPGESRRIEMTVTPGDLAFWSTPRSQWVMDAGLYRVWVGDGSDLSHLPLTATVARPSEDLGVDSGPAPVASSSL